MQAKETRGRFVRTIELATFDGEVGDRSGSYPRALMYHLEVCVETPEAANIAQKSGGTRVELCAALAIGGVTPSPALVKATLRMISCPTIVLIRLRSGSFVFTEVEKQIMLDDARQMMNYEIAGLAVGAVTVDRELDLPFLEEMRSIADGRQLVMHRAFDSLAEPWKAIDQLVSLGYHRILTSGGKDSAWEGRETLRSYQAYAAGRIEILPAGGINCRHAAELLACTECEQLHGSFQSRQGSEASTSFGSFILPDANEIREVAQLLK